MSLPTSPFEVEATKDIIQKHIDAGDIKQSDLDLLKRTYRWMSISSVVGSAGMGIPTILYLRNARPVRPLGIRLMVAGGMGMVGSFLGFTAGGVAAAMEVNRRMENPQEKMKIFHNIALEARQATIDRATGVAGASAGGGQRQRPIPGNPRPTNTSSGAYGDASSGVEAVGVQTSPSSWQSEAALDKLEADQERLRTTSAPGSAGGVGGTASPTKGEREAGNNAWDRLRKDAFPSESAGAGVKTPRPRAAAVPAGQAERDFGAGRAADMAPAAGGDARSAERSREQAEFDALLEKERQGGGGDKWA